MERFVKRHNAALAGLRASPARVMHRRVYAYLRRRLHQPGSADAIAAALFAIMQTCPRPSASLRRHLRVLAHRALLQVLAREPAVGPVAQLDLHGHLVQAVARLSPRHAAVLLGRSSGLDDIALARAANLPPALLDVYYSQAYALIRCTPWNA